MIVERLAGEEVFGPVAPVVGGGVGTLVVVASVPATWPALARIGPLSALRRDATREPSSARRSQGPRRRL